MHKIGTPLIVLALLFAVVSFIPVSYKVSSEHTAEATVEKVLPPQTEVPKEPEVVVDTRPVVTHVPLPKQVKAIYMTSCVAGTPSFRTKLIDLIQETELNAVIIDIKDYSGTISFPAQSVSWQSAWQEARCGTRDMPQLIELLHDHDIFVIGRITVFQDPHYAPKHPELAVLRSDKVTVWKDHKGLSFIDVAAKPYWDHIIELAIDSYNIGFDELNFDYVRYPSDGNMADTYYPQSSAGKYGMDRQANLESFFQYLHTELSNDERFATVRHENTGRATSTPWTSVDLFGMTTTNFDDLSIGQVQERAAPYFDFVAPMVYPSHYPSNYLGLGNPNDYPYKIVYHAMKTGADRMHSSTTPMQGFLHERIGTSTPALYQKPTYTGDRLRTWIQDFDYGGDYDAADVRAQIQASYDAGVQSWMIWAPSNIYTKAALLPE